MSDHIILPAEPTLSLFSPQVPDLAHFTWNTPDKVFNNGLIHPCSDRVLGRSHSLVMKLDMRRAEMRVVELSIAQYPESLVHKRSSMIEFMSYCCISCRALGCHEGKQSESEGGQGTAGDQFE